MISIRSSCACVTDNYTYIFDSSIWVEIERGNKSIQKRAAQLINKNKVCLVDLIVAELLRGVKSEGDYNGLKLRLLSYEILSTTWTEVGRLGFLMARQGYSPPLADLYIAAGPERPKLLQLLEKFLADDQCLELKAAAQEARTAIRVANGWPKFLARIWPFR